MTWLFAAAHMYFLIHFLLFWSNDWDIWRWNWSGMGAGYILIVLISWKTAYMILCNDSRSRWDASYLQAIISNSDSWGSISPMMVKPMLININIKEILNRLFSLPDTLSSRATVHVRTLVPQQEYLVLSDPRTTGQINIWTVCEQGLAIPSRLPPAPHSLDLALSETKSLHPRCRCFRDCSCLAATPYNDLWPTKNFLISWIPS